MAELDHGARCHPRGPDGARPRADGADGSLARWPAAARRRGVAPGAGGPAARRVAPIAAWPEYCLAVAGELPIVNEQLSASVLAASCCVETGPCPKGAL